MQPRGQAGAEFSTTHLAGIRRMSVGTGSGGIAGLRFIIVSVEDNQGAARTRDGELRNNRIGNFCETIEIQAARYRSRSLMAHD